VRLAEKLREIRRRLFGRGPESVPGRGCEGRNSRRRLWPRGRLSWRKRGGCRGGLPRRLSRRKWFARCAEQIGDGVRHRRFLPAWNSGPVLEEQRSDQAQGQRKPVLAVDR